MTSATDLELISHLECPICTEYMQPPIRQCVTGHSFCEPCFRKITTCSLCKGAKASTRNFTLEKVLEKLLFPCKHEGCKDIVKGGGLKQHLSVCDYQDYPCPIDSNCKWNGSFLHFREHYTNTHLTYKAKFTINKLLFKNIKNSTEAAIAIFEAYGEIFILERLIMKGLISWTVFHFGSEEVTKKFAFEVNVANSVVLKSPCLSINLFTGIQKDKKHGVLASNQVLDQFYVNGAFAYSMEIIKKEKNP